MRNIHFLWMALLVGLSACGDGRGFYPLEVVLDDPYARYADIDIEYEVTNADGARISSGLLADRLPLPLDRVLRFDDAFLARPGDWITLHTTFSVDGYTMSANNLLAEVHAVDDGFELSIVYRESRDDYLVSFFPYDE